MVPEVKGRIQYKIKQEMADKETIKQAITQAVIEASNAKVFAISS